MASRAVGALLAIVAAIAFVVSIASSAWWAGFPTIDGHTYNKKHLSVGPLGATGCNTGGNGECDAVPLGDTAKLVANIELAAIGLTIVLAFALAVSAWTIGDRRKGLAKATIAVTLLAAAGGAVLLAIGPGIATEGNAVTVPIAWGTFVFGGAVLSSLTASAITRTLEPEPLRLKPGIAPAASSPDASAPQLDPLGSPDPGASPFAAQHVGSNPFGVQHVGSNPFAAPHPGSEPSGSAIPGSNPFGAPHPGSNPSGSAIPGSNPFGAPHPGSNPSGSAIPGSNPFGAPYPGSNPSGPNPFGAPYPGSNPSGPGAPYPGSNPGPATPPLGDRMPQPGDPLGAPVDPFARTAPREQAGNAPPPMAPPPGRAKPASAAPPMRTRSPSVGPPPLDWSVPPDAARSTAQGSAQTRPPGRPSSPSSPPPRSSSASKPPPLGPRPSSPSSPPPRPTSASKPPPMGSRSNAPSNPPPMGRSTAPLGSVPARANTPSAAPPVRAAALGGPRTHTPAPGVPMPDRTKAPSIAPISRSDTTPVPVVGQRARTVPGPGTDPLATPLEMPAPARPSEPELRPSAPTMAHAIPPMPSPDNLPAPSVLPARDATAVEIDAEAKAAAAEATERGTLDPRISARALRLSTSARTGKQGTIGEDTAIGVDISSMDSRPSTTGVGIAAAGEGDDPDGRPATTGVDVVAAPPGRIITGHERALSTMQRQVARAPTEDPFDGRAHLYVPVDGPLTDELASPRSTEISAAMADDSPVTDVHDVPSAAELADELAAQSVAGAIGEVTDMNRAPDLLPPRETESTPIPTFHGRGPASQSMSTAPSSLPPPTVETVTAGPTPACPQCESPMAWVEEHLRFYCKQCRMYF